MNTIYKGSEEYYTNFLKVWESAVKATHNFLSEEDFNSIKSLLITDYFPMVDLYYTRNEKNQITGFIGVNKDKVEMLFIDAAERGKGIGKSLLDFSVNKLNVKKVDVNEQNEQAVGFYKKYGFKTVKRSDVDSQGKPYPILEMSLI